MIGDFLLNKTEDVLEVEAKWVKLNYKNKGFYRVLYEYHEDLFEEIRTLEVEDRVGIVQDYFWHFSQNLIDFGQIVSLIDSLIPEFEYSIISFLDSTITKHLKSPKSYQYLSPILQRLLKPL